MSTAALIHFDAPIIAHAAVFPVRGQGGGMYPPIRLVSGTSVHASAAARRIPGVGRPLCSSLILHPAGRTGRPTLPAAPEITIRRADRRPHGGGDGQARAEVLLGAFPVRAGGISGAAGIAWRCSSRRERYCWGLPTGKGAS